MTGNFEVKYLFLKKWNNIVILPISILLLLVAVIFGGALLYGIALLLLLGALAVNCLWFPLATWDTKPALPNCGIKATLTGSTF